MNTTKNNQTSVADLLAKTVKYLDESKKRRTTLLQAVPMLVSDSDKTMAELEVMRKEMDADLKSAELELIRNLASETLNFIGSVDADERQEDQEDESEDEELETGADQNAAS